MTKLKYFHEILKCIFNGNLMKEISCFELFKNFLSNHLIVLKAHLFVIKLIKHTT